MNNFMNIDIKEYLKKYIGHTDWYGETEYDNESCYNLDKLDKILTEIEDLREVLLLKLFEHKTYHKGNKSAELLHKQAKDIMSKHIIKEFTHTDFEEFWESSNE